MLLPPKDTDKFSVRVALNDEFRDSLVLTLELHTSHDDFGEALIEATDYFHLSVNHQTQLTEQLAALKQQALTAYKRKQNELTEQKEKLSAQVQALLEQYDKLARMMLKDDLSS